MMPFDSFPWPPPQGSSTSAHWNGHSFEVAGQTTQVLIYAAESSHWSAELTSLHETEAGPNHPIDVASRRLAIASMKRIPGNAPVVMDVGCSSGFLLEELRQAHPQANLIGADYLRGPLESLAQRIPDIPILQFDLRKCPLPDCCVDGVTCLNVLEHIDDHAAALAAIYRILKPGGRAHIEVPAGPPLHDIYDEHLMHHRRYSLEQLVTMARHDGFEVLKATHLGFFIFPAFLFTKRRNRKKHSLPPWEKAKFVAQQIRQTRTSPFFTLLMSIETTLGRFISYPWGIRCVVVLRKT